MVEPREALTPEPLDPALRFLDALVAAAPIGVGLLDRDLRFVRVNDALARANGRARDEHLGRALDEVWPDIPPDLVRRLLEALEGGPAVVDYEVSSMTPAGRRQVLGNYYPIAGADGRPAGVGIVVLDITARKRAEEALRVSERRLRDVLEGIRLVAASVDLEGSITYCNPYLCRLTGWNRGELMGRDWFSTFDPPEVTGVREWYLESLARGEIDPHSENFIVTRDGRRRLIRWSNTLVRDSAGHVVGGTSIGEDITERRAAERALALQYAVARALADAGSVDAAAAQVLEQLGGALEARYASLWRVDDEEELLQCVVGWSSSDDPAVQAFATRARGLELRRGEALAGAVWERDEPVWFEDVRAHPRFLDPELAAAAGLAGAVGLPASVAGRVAGVLVFFFAHPLAEEPAILELLRSLGSQIGQFIERRRAEERAEAELRDSRARILAAAREERRRLEGELHAGVQQRLSSLLVGLRLARGRIGDVAAARIIDAAGDELSAALDELREFGRGIHPAVLTHLGLGAALESLADRSHGTVALAGAPAARLPEAVEAAAYDVVRELVEGAAGRAEQPLRVAVTAGERAAEILVEGDGLPVADEARVRAAADRVEGAGGIFVVESAGARLRAELPFEPAS